jgi:hypothetical protein
MKVCRKVIVVNSKSYKNYDESIIEVDFKDLLDCENYSLEKTVFDQMRESISQLCLSVSSGVSVVIHNCDLLFGDWNNFISSSNGLNKYKIEDTRVLSYGIDFLERIGKLDSVEILLDSKVECRDSRISSLYKHIYLD